MQDLLAQVVQHHDVGVHVEQVVGVGRVVVCGPRLRLWAFVREHVVTVFRLIIHTVKPCHLQNTDNGSTFAKQITKLCASPSVRLTLCLFCSQRVLSFPFKSFPFVIIKVLTYFKNICIALCFCGLTVASKRGRKMFSSILAKCGTNFFDLKMSLQDKRNQMNSSSHINNKHLFALCVLLLFLI